jgi:hypothetical protein
VIHNHEKERNLIIKIIIMINQGFPRVPHARGANFKKWRGRGREGVKLIGFSIKFLKYRREESSLSIS